MVSDNTLYTDMWTEMKNLSVAALSEASITASVEAAFTNKKTTKPMVVIPPIKAPETMDKFGSSEGRKNISTVLYCYGSSSLIVDTLRQAVVNKVKEDGISGVGLTSIEDDYDFTEINDSPYHLVTLTVNYLRE